MNAQSLKKSLAAALLGLLLASKASAGLVGDTVGARYYSTTSGYSSGLELSVVGAGEEGNFFGNQYFNFGDFDFSIRSTDFFTGINSSSSADLISLELSSLNFPGVLTGVSFQTNLSGVSYVMGVDSVTFTWNEQSISQGTYLTAQFNASSQPATVPDSASSLSLVGLALVGLVAVRRKLS